MRRLLILLFFISDPGQSGGGPVLSPDWQSPVIPLSKGAQIRPICDPSLNVPCFQQWVNMARPLAVTAPGASVPSMEYFLPALVIDSRLASSAGWNDWELWTPPVYSKRRSSSSSGRVKYYRNRKDPGRLRVQTVRKDGTKKVEEGKVVLAPAEAVQAIDPDNTKQSGASGSSQPQSRQRAEPPSAGLTEQEARGASEESGVQGAVGRGKGKGGSTAPSGDSALQETLRTGRRARRAGRTGTLSNLYPPSSSAAKAGSGIAKGGIGTEGETSSKPTDYFSRKQGKAVKIQKQRARGSGGKKAPPAAAAKSSRLEESGDSDSGRRRGEASLNSESAAGGGRGYMDRIRRIARGEGAAEEASFRRGGMRRGGAPDRENDPARTARGFSGFASGSAGEKDDTAPSSTDPGLRLEGSRSTGRRAAARRTTSRRTAARREGGRTGEARETSDRLLRGAASTEPGSPGRILSAAEEGGIDKEASSSGDLPLGETLSAREGAQQARPPSSRRTTSHRTAARRTSSRRTAKLFGPSAAPAGGGGSMRPRAASSGEAMSSTSAPGSIPRAQLTQDVRAVSAQITSDPSPKECVDASAPDASSEAEDCSSCEGSERVHHSDKGVMNVVRSLWESIHTTTQRKIKAGAAGGASICSPQAVFKSVIRNFEKTCKPLSFKEFLPKVYCKACARNIPLSIMLSMMTAESSGKCHAEGDDDDSIGLFQVNTNSWSCNKKKRNSSDNKKCLLNPWNSFQCGMDALQTMYQRSNKRPPPQESPSCPSWTDADGKERDFWRRAVSAYNGGHGRVRQSIRRLEKDFSLNRNNIAFEDLRTVYLIRCIERRGSDTREKCRHELSNLAHVEAILGREGGQKGALPSLADYWEAYLKQAKKKGGFSSCPSAASRPLCSDRK